jgi:hypothetical protein
MIYKAKKMEKTKTIPGSYLGAVVKDMKVNLSTPGFKFATIAALATNAIGLGIAEKVDRFAINGIRDILSPDPVLSLMFPFNMAVPALTGMFATAVSVGAVMVLGGTYALLRDNYETPNLNAFREARRD